jgi:hypothetical protein
MGFLNLIIMKNIATALVKAQLEMVAPKKGSVNPFFKNKYADLNDVLSATVPALNNNGIVLLQPLVNIDGKNFVKTVLMHESGETFESLAEIFCSKPNDAQAYGSGISYARRYSLSSICGIGSEDDDAQKAVAAKPLATDEILAKAKAAGYTIAQVKSKYTVTSEQEKNY